MAKVLAFGLCLHDGLLEVSTDRLDYEGCTGCEIIELVDKRDLDIALQRIAELETNQTLQP